MVRFALALLAISSVFAPALAQAQAANDATLLSAADAQAEITKAVQGAISDHIVRTVDAGAYNVATAIVIRRLAGSAGKAIGNVGGALSHGKITEIYYVVRGSGVQVTGGTLVDPKQQAGGGATGPGSSGSGIQGGHDTTLGAGDSLIIPPGVPHMWRSILAFAVAQAQGRCRTPWATNPPAARSTGRMPRLLFTRWSIFFNMT